MAECSIPFPLSLPLVLGIAFKAEPIVMPRGQNFTRVLRFSMFNQMPFIRDTSEYFHSCPKLMYYDLFSSTIDHPLHLFVL